MSQAQTEAKQLRGKDASGKEEYQDPDTLWQKAKGQDGTHRDWYQGAVSYWDQQEASYDGVLGGFGYVSDYDISDSSALLTRVSERVCEREAPAKADWWGLQR